MKKARVHSYNILEVGPGERELWQFQTDNGEVSLSGNHVRRGLETFPTRWVGKDWRNLWQAKLNIAWFPADQVFLRVVHLPAADLGELLAMVELQLEKLSPIPTNQIVWSVELVPAAPGAAESMQTAVVIVVARDVVEKFLGHLETQGYLPDRLEIPFLHQVLRAVPGRNSVCVYPVQEEPKTICLVAWWYQGTLQNLNLAHLASSNTAPPGDLLVEQLTKTAWAGELEGWLTEAPFCYIIADEPTAERWAPSLRAWADQQFERLDTLPKRQLAQLTATEAGRAPNQGNLLPAEFRARYRQQFIDGLWMRGLGALVAIYLIGVLVYFAALEVIKYQHRQVTSQAGALSGAYTNALQTKARVAILQDQLGLKYAALDAWRAVAEVLPAELTLTSFNFTRGKTLLLTGTAPADDVAKIGDYNEALRKISLQDNGTQLFASVEPPRYTTDPGGKTMTWRFLCELKRAEIE